MKVFISLAVFLLIHYTSGSSYEIEEKWENYKNQFNKNYDSKEDSERFEIFKKNLANIEAHNKRYERGEVSYSMKLNEMADWKANESIRLRGAIEGPNEMEKRWKNYKIEFNKNYDSEEDKERFEIFKKNFAIIQAHNKRFRNGEVSYSMRLNKMSDWNANESKRLRGTIEGPDEIKKKWKDFKKKFDKNYDSKEDSKRFEIFKKNLAIIEAHNKRYERGEVSYSMKLNHLSDWEKGEEKRMFGAIEGPNEMEKRWKNYKNEFNKNYDSEEDDERFEIFKKNYAIIKAHNKRFRNGEVSYSMRLNKMSDWNANERSRLNGANSASDSSSEY